MSQVRGYDTPGSLVSTTETHAKLPLLHSNTQPRVLLVSIVTVLHTEPCEFQLSIRTSHPAQGLYFR